MAKTPTTSTKPQSDILPDIDDDAEEISTASYVETGSGDDESADVAHEDDKPLSPREEAVRKYRELRQKSQDVVSAQDESVDDDVSGDDADQESDPDPVDAVRSTPSATDADEEQTFTLIVDGRPVQMKQSEVLAKAQIAVASDNRLDEAKRLLQEARALRGSSDDRTNQPDVDADLNAHDDPSPARKEAVNQSKPSFDPEKLENIVERIQIGDKDEGSQALAELIEIVSSAGNDRDTLKPDDIGRVVNEQLARSRIQGEIEQAAASFKDKYAGITSDPDMLDMSLNRLGSEVRQDLLNAGIAEAEKASKERLLELHSQARIRGLRVNPIQVHFDKVGKELSSKFASVLGSKTDGSEPATSRQSQPKQPVPSTRVAERMDRKRSAQVQPRSAGMRAAPVSTQKPTHRDYVESLRKSRGYSV